ncbi:structure-specific endonuclease subunit SLX4 [Blastomyces parvus]|uniref:Structure-specific endonuclease subunit SLX4 n=1 Tax=Blastomyces parvus TaxID=2060905 RepID=A0A2B7WW96_9EURO|nr:structure-specific endonuclease subunit SLX4 [Blastomyces parvus]
MDNVAIASQSNTPPSNGRSSPRFVTPIIVDSSPINITAKVIEPSSPFSPPSPSTLLTSLSKSSYPKGSDLRIDGAETTCREGLRSGRRLGRSPQRLDKSITGSKAKPASTTGLEQRTTGSKIATQTEIQITDGDQFIVSTKTRKKKGATAKRTRKRDGVAEKKLHGHVSKVKSPGNLELDAKIPLSKACDDKAPPAGDNTDNELRHLTSGLQLEQATKRRLDWTPTKDVTIPIVDLAEVHSSSCGESVTRTHSAGALLSNYGFSGVVKIPLASKPETYHNAPATKRPMELHNFYTGSEIPTTPESRPATNDTQSISSKQQRVKAKKPQKTKLTTVTSYATAKYSVADQTDDLDRIQTVNSEKNNKRGTTKRPAGTKRANTARGKSDTLKNGNEPPVFKVVPPLEAFKSFDGQELLFGTSSQLEHGHSEDQGEEIQYTSNSVNKSNAVPGPAVSKDLGSRLSTLSSSKNLWSASARDLAGAVLHVEEIDLSESSIEFSAPAAKSKHQTETWDPSDQNAVDLDVEDDTRTPAANNDTREPDNTNELPLEEDDIVYRENLAPTSVKLNSKTAANISESMLDRPHPDEPIFSGFTTSELAKKVAAYGFKPIKSRDKMISLLEKCWENESKSSKPEPKPKQRSYKTQGHDLAERQTLGLKPRSDSIAFVHTRSPKKGLAKSSLESQELKNFSLSTEGSTITSKLSMKRFVSPCAILIDDDPSSDSVAEALPPSPFHSSNGNGTSYSPQDFREVHSPTIQMPIRSTKSFTSASSSMDLPSISTQITKAVRSQPRIKAFNGLKQPTWYEKILMYDPIQLEDLAAWLNTDGFGRIGEDREVGPGVVREWCESKGICCVWKKPASTKSH